MPELPEVETIKRTLSPLICGRVIQRLEIRLAKILRSDPELFQKSLPGQKIKALSRRGKLLIIHLTQNALLFHFRMTGNLIYLVPSASEPRYTHLLFYLDQGIRLAYTDLRQFGWIELVKEKDLSHHRILAKLGPEPFELNEKEFFALLRTRNRGLKAFLLDQEMIAGLGNIYTDEALFRAGLHPKRKTSSLSFEEAGRLLRVIKEVLEEAIRERGSSVRNYVDGQGQRGNFQRQHLVYRKRGEPCPRCGQEIAYQKIAGRGTYFCPGCQK